MHYILLELLKNALRATVETHGIDADYPPVEVIIADGNENEDVVIKYNGVNYGKSLGFIYKKSALYATASMGLKYYRGPYYNLILFFLGVFISLSFPYLIPWLFLGYLFLRGFLIPIRKSRGVVIFKEFSLSFLSLPLVGLTIDCGRIVGFTKGFFKYHIFKR